MSATPLSLYFALPPSATPLFLVQRRAKERSRRPGAAAPAGILASGHPDRGLDAVDDALSTVGASGSPAVAARGRQRGGKRWLARDFRVRADSRVHREWRHCATSGRKGCGTGGERYAPATFLDRREGRLAGVGGHAPPCAPAPHASGGPRGRRRARGGGAGRPRPGTVPGRMGHQDPRRRRGRPRSGVPAAHGRAGGGLPHDDPRAGGDQCQAARPRTAPHPPGPGSGGQGLLLQGQPGLAARPPHPRHDPGSNTPPAIVTEPASPDYVDVTSNRQTQTIDRDSSLAQMPQRAVACSHGQGLRQPSG